MGTCGKRKACILGGGTLVQVRPLGRRLLPHCLTSSCAGLGDGGEQPVPRFIFAAAFHSSAKGAESPMFLQPPLLLGVHQCQLFRRHAESFFSFPLTL